MAEETPFQKLVKDSRPRAARPGPGKGNRRGRVHGSRVSSRDREAMFRIYRETGNVAETARRTGWEYGTVWKHVKAAERDNLAGRALVDIGPPKNWDELTEQERGWLVDFGSFRRHFLRRETPPFHQQIADTISQGLYPKIQVLCPPGHGKTQCFSVDYPIWEMIRQRTMGPKRENWDGWGCLLISAGDKLAKAFLSQIKHELEQNTDLQLAYGRFKPEYPDQWSQFQVTVEGFPIRKEATFTAAGAKSRIYGWRPHLIIGDDIVDDQNSNTPEKAAELDQWHADILTTRLEPGGVVANIGTRFSMFDLHGKLIRKRDDDGEPLWHPILYRAHDDSQCSGTHCMECKERCVHDRPWPEGCLLWPGRFSYRKLRSIRSGSTTTARFEFLYQQYEVPDEGALVKPEWSEKCKNTNRLVWDIPQGTKVMCTLDPSPTKWAVAQCWALGVDGITGEERHYFVNQWRKKRTMAPEYLALMRDWTKIIRSKGKDPIWVVEINAAQRWMLQCFTPDTEILTQDGWRPVAEVLVGTPVATMDPVTREMTYQPVTNTQTFAFEGDLVTCWQKFGVSFSVTPNHSMWATTNWRPDLIRRYRADELPISARIPQWARWGGDPPPGFVAFRSDGHNGRTVSFGWKEWAEFLGWFISEGSTDTSRWAISLSQVKLEGRAQIANLLDRMDVNYHVLERSFSFNNKGLVKWLRVNTGCHARTKRVPREVKELDSEFLRILLIALVDGDGSWTRRPNLGRFYTASQQLADDVCEIALKCGYRSTTLKMPENKPGDPYGRGDGRLCVSIRFQNAKDTELNSRNASGQMHPVVREPYRGPVHCVTVPPHHTVFIRHKGRVSWSGQSTEYQMMRAELGMTVIPHTTGRNKADPEYGIQCIGPLYEFQRVDLPWGDAESRRTVQALLDELHAYDAGETDDCVLAHWFFTFNKRRLTNVTGSRFYDQAYMPPYLLKTRALIDTHTGLRTEVS